MIVLETLKQVQHSLPDMVVVDGTSSTDYRDDNCVRDLFRDSLVRRKGLDGVND